MPTNQPLVCPAPQIDNITPARGLTLKSRLKDSGETQKDSQFGGFGQG
ncbi:MAG TPA: hypothetical protein VGI40_07765 [Pirellulaceae bacterium]